MPRNRLFLGLFSLMLTTGLWAQSDFSSWLSAEVKYDINKDWTVGLEAQSRNDLRSGGFNTTFLSPSVSWQPMKHFETALSYRISSVPYSNSTTNRVGKHRITADFTFRKIESLILSKKSRLGMSLRLRGTTEHQAEERVENTLRLKLKFQYNLPKTKLDLFASTEVFYRFQRDLIYTFSEVQSVSAINKYRIKLGGSYPIGDQHEIKLFAMPQWRYPDKVNELVFGLGYSYQIN
ncbi:MAG: DUF2490 domain-containing protein [Crocinitomicaceae bacterium]|nr:DUF2490 domain-containing protein [Crocinitomicaceae bacterium]